MQICRLIGSQTLSVHYPTLLAEAVQGSSGRSVTASGHPLRKLSLVAFIDSAAAAIDDRVA